jgi:hypothetical protein
MTTNCSKCNCAKAQCGCEDIGLTTNIACGAPTCPNPEPCAETWSDCCVIHNGDSFTWVPDIPDPDAPPFSILQGERMCDTWQKFLAYYNCGQDPASIPYGLKSTNITSTTLTIAWTPITAVTVAAYEVYIAPVSTGIFALAGTTPQSTTPTFTVTGLTPNTSYYIKIIAGNPPDKRCASVSLILTTKLT